MASFVPQQSSFVMRCVGATIITTCNKLVISTFDQTAKYIITKQHDMKREDAIKLCRYYHGEKECKLKEQTDIMFWEYERVWVHETLKENDTSFFSEMLSLYLVIGLKDFEKFDDTPITLKALLFDRFCKWRSGAPIDNVSEFKTFYKQTYKSK